MYSTEQSYNRILQLAYIINTTIYELILPFDVWGSFIPPYFCITFNCLILFASVQIKMFCCSYNYHNFYYRITCKHKLYSEMDEEERIGGGLCCK